MWYLYRDGQFDHWNKADSRNKITNIWRLVTCEMTQKITEKRRAHLIYDVDIHLLFRKISTDRPLPYTTDDRSKWIIIKMRKKHFEIVNKL